MKAAADAVAVVVVVMGAGVAVAAVTAAFAARTAMARAAAYAEAGADMLFVEAPGSIDELKAIVQALGGKVPLMANMVEGGMTPVLSSAELEALGFAMVIFPGGIVRAIAPAAQAFYAALKTQGTTASIRNQMFGFDELNGVIGTPVMLELGKRYESGT